MLMRVSALNAALYRGRGRILAGSRSADPGPDKSAPIPRAVKDVANTVIEDIFEIAGWAKILTKYGADIGESASIGYILSANEDWQELDRERAVELMDESLRAVQATRAKLGTAQISLDSVDNRLTVMTMGLATGAAERRSAS
jgi:flagellin-like hook-associated protein FlgL